LYSKGPERGLFAYMGRWRSTRSKEESRGDFLVLRTAEERIANEQEDGWNGETEGPKLARGGKPDGVVTIKRRSQNGCSD